jgi:molybdopterin/thiamine biosynthesis adenylyltransferase
MKLRIATTDLRTLHRRLLAVAPAEGAAFLAAEEAGSDLVMREAHVFGADDVEGGDAALTISEQAKVAALAKIKRAGHAVVEVHTHPRADRRVSFSSFDESEMPAFAQYVQRKIPDRPFGALVFGRRAYAGRVFEPAGGQGALSLRAVGERSDELSWLSEPSPRPTDDGGIPNRFDRQVRAIGPEGQAALQRLTVGVVGVGGTGSVAFQQLAHLGITRFVLVDDDRVESTNLHRLAGSSRRDAWFRRRKTSVARRVIRRLSSRASVTVRGNLQSHESLEALKTVDLIVGCVDNDGARLIISELAAAYLIPYLDLGVGIEQEGEGAIGGRAAFFLPGGPCLACADELDFGEAAEDLESDAQRTVRRARGYARDRRVEAALMPLNTAIAGIGILEFLAFATGIDRVVPFQRYDALARRTIRLNAERDPQCPVCAPASAMGDRHRIERFAA